MGDGFVFIEIVIFAMIAAFLVYRLRSVLGRRTGEEQQRPNPFTARAGQPDNVIPLPNRDRPRLDAVTAAPDEPLSLAASLDQIKAADSSFDEKHFLDGAKAAFQMIVESFARGDSAALRPLLADDVFASFDRVIRERQSRGETDETRVERVREAEVVEARLDQGRYAVVTVRLVSDQINALRGRDGVVIEGDPNAVVEANDVWAFARDTQSRSPNWALIEIKAVH
jgi:predicted lipid-binding transport protein (Tim44 family)